MSLPNMSLSCCGLRWLCCVVNCFLYIMLGRVGKGRDGAEQAVRGRAQFGNVGDVCWGNSRADSPSISEPRRSAPTAEGGGQKGGGREGVKALFKVEKRVTSKQSFTKSLFRPFYLYGSLL